MSGAHLMAHVEEKAWASHRSPLTEEVKQGRLGKRTMSISARDTKCESVDPGGGVCEASGILGTRFGGGAKCGLAWIGVLASCWKEYDKRGTFGEEKWTSRAFDPLELRHLFEESDIKK